MRPHVHLTGQRGWVNDPHGITVHDGRYHVFHQAVPDSLTHQVGCSWGHATSPDLLRFDHHAPVLEPDADEDGIWTGSVAVGREGPRLFYTAVDLPDVGIGRVRVATPTDDLWEVWKKGDIVVTAPEGLDLIAFRDPFVLPDGDRWRMLVGGATADGRALALTWVSDDLDAWGYDGVALERSTDERDPVWMGALWECPQFFEVGAHWAMVSSVWDDDVLHYAGYSLGTLQDGRFDASTWGRLTWGTYYAPSFFRDAAGRPCLMLWMRDVGDVADGWESCISIPHVLEVRDGRLAALPHPNLTAARDTVIDTGGDLPEAAIEIEWQPDATGARLELLGGDQATTLTMEHDVLTVHTGHRDRAGCEANGWTVPLTTAGAPHPVRLLVDGPALEVWVDGRILGSPVSPPRRLRAEGTVKAWLVRPGD